jgi:LuxR family maltose regulon positive regulatory protein
VGLADPPTYLGEFDQLTLARLVLAQRRAGADVGLGPVREMLDRVLGAATAAGRDGSVIEVLVVRSLVSAADGDRPAAVRDLTEALTAGHPVGYRRLFLDEGTPLHDLLREVAATRSGEAAASAARLLAGADERRPRPAGPSVPGGEGLSEREVEVLRLLATDLTGPEIARRLFVSVNTLRTHTKHIFTKLGVNSRRAAVSRAAELGLL